MSAKTSGPGSAPVDTVGAASGSEPTMSGPEPAEVLNPLTGEALPKKAAAYVATLKAVRSGARKAMRSGNPAKRADAVRVAVEAPALIRETYLADHRRWVATL